MKQGDGPINYDWGERYLVLDEARGLLMWYDGTDATFEKGRSELKRA